MACVSGLLATVVLLILCRMEEIAEACSCSPVHPQQAFCNSDIGKWDRKRKWRGDVRKRPDTDLTAKSNGYSWQCGKQ